MLSACCADVGPACASFRLYSADDSWSCAAVSAVWAELGSILASTSPTETVSPIATSTAVSVPLVAKSSDVVVAELTLPDAVTLAWTVPRCTVAVRVTPALRAAMLATFPASR